MLVKLPSPKNGRGDTSSRCLCFVFGHIYLVAIFVAGIMVGKGFDRDLYLSDYTQLRQDSGETEKQLRTPLSVPRKTEGEVGWTTINVFYGSNNYFESSLPSDRKFYSQVRQDEAVLGLLRNKTNGYFVDLASNDATTLSNSYALERFYGWKGLCIEPNPMYWYNLTHARKNCELVGAVVGRNRMDQVDFIFNTVNSGIVGNGFDNNGPRVKHHSRKEYTVTLSEIFKKFDVPRVIDYLSLDVEGAEGLIMDEFPLADYRIRIMTIERPKPKLRTYLESHGYIQVLRISRWGETLWIHSSFEEFMDMTHLQEFHGKRQYEELKARNKLSSS